MALPEATMDWLPLVYATASLASGVVTALSLRRLGRAIAWNVYLKCIGVGTEHRQALALRTARLDLQTEPTPTPTGSPSPTEIPSVKPPT